MDQWPVLIRDHHPGYLSWQDYLANQPKIRPPVVSHVLRNAARRPHAGGLRHPFSTELETWPMSDPLIDPDDVLSGAQRLDLAVSRNVLLPRETETMRTILRHLLAANDALREPADAHDTTQLTAPLLSCLSELARFGQ